LDATFAAPPEVGVLTVTVRNNAGYQLKNQESTSFASDSKYTFNQEKTEYGVTGNFGSAAVSLVDIEAFGAEPPLVNIHKTHFASSESSTCTV